MKNNKKIITKLSCFYVSDWHLVTMWIPYINKNISEEVKIITILEDNLYNNIETLIKKLNLKNKEKILKLDWKKTNPLSYEVIKNKIKDAQNEKKCIIINGSEKYVEDANYIVEKYIKQTNKDIDNSIKVLNCYDVTKIKQNINSILDNSDKILNTSGENEIEKIYINYKKTGSE